jgi:uncharacterized protein YjbI with pentapeptide repeats
MADPAHLEVLRQGVDAWNAWRTKERISAPDLSRASLYRTDFSGPRAYVMGADLRGANLYRANLSAAYLQLADLREADLRKANLYQANLSAANLREARLSGADLSGANLSGANLSGVDLSGLTNLTGASLSRASLSGANLREARLSGADLSGADLRQADLSGADLYYANLVEADLASANLTGCCVYGVSAWGLKLSEETAQHDLIITKSAEPEITVDNIEVAQFIYLLLNNQKIRDVIDTVTSKAVLILGRFTPERKGVLDALRSELRRRNYLPILFDFDKPAGRDITETVSLLARMALFVVADITDAKSIPQELGNIVPHLPSVPVQPLLLEGNDEYSMFEHFKRYPWVLKTYRYESQEQLIGNLADRVIRPAEAKVLELRGPARPKANLGRDEGEPKAPP